MNRVLWVVQILLALLFLMTGVSKLITPAEQLAAQTPLPVWFLRFIGAMEILGALGLVLPGMLHKRTSLVPLAAACLSIIMIGALIVTLAYVGAAMAILPLVTGLLTVFVAWGRWRLA